jgi:hypothetical protein
LAQVIGVAKDKTAKIMVFAREENLRSAEFDAHAPSNGFVEPFYVILPKSSVQFQRPTSRPWDKGRQKPSCQLIEWRFAVKPKAIWATPYGIMSV